MKTGKFLTAFIGMLSICSVSLAEPTQQTEQTQPQTVILVKNNKDTHIKRPKAPDRQQVICAYDGEMICLNIAIPEGMATLSVTDESMKVLTYEIDTTPLDICVTTGALIGNVYIELETEKGNIFTGTIE